MLYKSPHGHSICNNCMHGQYTSAQFKTDGMQFVCTEWYARHRTQTPYEVF